MNAVIRTESELQNATQHRVFTRKFGFDITSHMRKTGAVLDRFGFANVRRGGHSVEFYLDDLSYTARRVKGDTPRFHKQTYVKAPYPHKSAGRRY